MMINFKGMLFRIRSIVFPYVSAVFELGDLIALVDIEFWQLHSPLDPLCYFRIVVGSDSHLLAFGHFGGGIDFLIIR